MPDPLNLLVNTIVGKRSLNFFAPSYRMRGRLVVYRENIMIKKCLTIAGSDCSGGAGIQADLKTFSAHGCYGASVITSVVAENTSRVISVFNVPAEEIEKQIDAVFEDIEIDAVKLGMLPTEEIIRAVAAKMRQYKPRCIVCDPVMVATSGDALSESGVCQAFIDNMFPIADLITPNIIEAETFLGGYLENVVNMKEAARILHEYGAKAVLVKGGHLDGEPVDVLFDGKEYHELSARRIDSPNTHGTGCTLSSAIAANLANGAEMKDAVRLAKDYVTNAIEKSYTVGKGHSPVHHFYKLWR